MDANLLLFELPLWIIIVLRWKYFHTIHEINVRCMNIGKLDMTLYQVDSLLQPILEESKIHPKNMIYSTIAQKLLSYKDTIKKIRKMSVDVWNDMDDEKVGR